MTTPHVYDCVHTCRHCTSKHTRVSAHVHTPPETHAHVYIVYTALLEEMHTHTSTRLWVTHSHTYTHIHMRAHTSTRAAIFTKSCSCAHSNTLAHGQRHTCMQTCTLTGAHLPWRLLLSRGPSHRAPSPPLCTPRPFPAPGLHQASYPAEKSERTSQGLWSRAGWGAGHMRL